MIFFQEIYDYNNKDQETMMKYYSMTLVWSTFCKFIFPSWATESTITFIIGCAATLLLCFLSMAMPKIRQKLQKMLFKYQRSSVISDGLYQSQSSDQENVRLTTAQQIVKKMVIPFFYYLFYSTFHVVIMIIMMSMNAYVIMAIILGYTLGYFCFSDVCKKKLKNECSERCHGGQ